MRLVDQLKRRFDNVTTSVLSDAAYIKAYAQHMDRRVAEDPHNAPGGLWEEIGALQFEFLVRQGLRPQHRLLDIGCGTLRGGRHFVRYLEQGNYTGFDISQAAIEASWALCDRENLTDKSPRLFVTRRSVLDFEEVGTSCDYLLAQSVFTHLRKSQIADCLGHVHRVMHAGSHFYFTFFEGQQPQVPTWDNFAYERAELAALAAASGLSLRFCDDYPHPRQQRMAVVTLTG